MTDREPDSAQEAALDEWLDYTDEDDGKPRRWDWFVTAAVILGIVTVAGFAMLWPTGESAEQVSALSMLGIPSEFYAADVARVEDAPCVGAPSIVCSTVDFELTAGPDAGFVHTQEFAHGPVTPDFRVGQTAILSYTPTNAVIDTMGVETCSIDETQMCVVLSLLVGSGSDTQRLDYQLYPGEEDGSYFPGAAVLAQFVEGNDGEMELFSISPESPYRQYSFADFQRRNILLWLSILFIGVVVVLGRWRGAAALAGLVASVAMLLLFILPAILDGRSPVLVAVFGSAGIAFIALYVAHGFNRMTTVAVIGTMGGLALTAVLSAIVVGASDFTGLVTEESSILTVFEGFDVRGLLLAGIVLGAAGAIDDVTVTQASAVWELKAANPSLPVPELIRRGLRIGRDHIASMVNTLLLAYAGASLPLVVLFVLSEQSLGTVANSEVVAVEIVRTLVGSIGLVAAVPFTTWLAALAADGRSFEDHS